LGGALEGRGGLVGVVVCRRDVDEPVSVPRCLKPWVGVLGVGGPQPPIRNPLLGIWDWGWGIQGSGFEVKVVVFRVQGLFTS
jgi:hypothetical protein